MAYWKAAALARDYSSEETPSKLVEALDALDEIASELDVDSFPIGEPSVLTGSEAHVEAILKAIQTLKDDVERSEEARTDAEREKADVADELEATKRELAAVRIELEAARAGAGATIAALKKPPALSANCRAALQASATDKGIGPWDFGSGTIGALKKRGYIERGEYPQNERYYITTAGKEAL